MKRELGLAFWSINPSQLDDIDDDMCNKSVIAIHINKALNESWSKQTPSKLT